MTKDDKDIDSALREAVAGEVGRERFDLWFGDGVELRLTGESLLVSAADQFTLDRLRVHFRPALLAACSRVTGSPVEVRFELAPASHASPHADLADVIPLVAPDSSKQDHSSRQNQDQRSSESAGRRRFATLKEFVVGEGNRVAWTASQMVVERPGTVSPLFLFGPPGTGKTHLLEGIWSAVRAVPPAGACSI